MFTKRMIILFGIILGISLILLISRSPVIVRVPKPHSVRGEPFLVVFNPFRNKQPEIVAEVFLESLKNGRCLESTVSFGSEKSTQICRKQAEYPLQEWKLTDMTKENETIWVTYKHTSKNSNGSEEMMVRVDKIEQNWKIVDFIIGY